MRSKPWPRAARTASHDRQHAAWIGRSMPRREAERLSGGQGPLYRRHRRRQRRPCRVPAQPVCACAHRRDRRRGGEAVARRDRRRDRRRSRRSLQALADAARAGPEPRLAAAASARPRRSLLAGRSRRRRRRATRAQAEDAVELIEIDWAELPAIADLEAAAAPDAPRSTRHGEQSRPRPSFVGRRSRQAFRDAAVVVEHDFVFERQTGVTLEPRAIVADFDPRLRQLDDAPFASGAAPDARRFRDAARAAAGARARRHAGCRRRVRHEARRPIRTRWRSRPSRCCSAGR